MSVTTVPLTYDSYYVKPMKFYIELWSPEEDILYGTYNAFQSDQRDFALTDLNMDLVGQGISALGVTIDDSLEKNLDLNNINNGMVVKAKWGKSEEELKNCFWGICDGRGVRSYGDSLKINLQCRGFKVVPSYTIMNFQFVAPPESLKPAVLFAKTVNPDYAANNIVRKIFERLDFMPLGDTTLADRFGPGLDLSGILETVNDFIADVRNPLVPVSQFFDIIANMTGGSWDMDENKKFHLYYPLARHSGIIIKDTPEDTDHGDSVSYVLDTIAYNDSIRAEDGFTNRFISIANQIAVAPGGQSQGFAFTSLFNKFLGQIMIPGSPQFENLSFLLSKVNAGTDANRPRDSKLHGYVVLDKNFTPTGELVGEFSIPIIDIPDTPTALSPLNFNKKVKTIQINQPHWVILEEKGDSENNTIRWWHDDDPTTPSTTDNLRYSAIQPRPKGFSDGDKRSDTGWYIFPQGPKFTFASTTTSQIMVEASNTSSIKQWTPKRAVETRIDVPFLNTVESLRHYLSLMVQMTGKKIRSYEQMLCTIPNKLFAPNTSVQVVSTKNRSLAFTKNVQAQVGRINVALVSNDYSEGVTECLVELRGYVSPILREY